MVPMMGRPPVMIVKTCLENLAFVFFWKGAWGLLNEMDRPDTAWIYNASCLAFGVSFFIMVTRAYSPGGATKPGAIAACGEAV